MINNIYNNSAYKTIILHKFSNLNLKSQSKSYKYIPVEFYDNNNGIVYPLTKEKVINCYENKITEDEYDNKCIISLNSPAYKYETLHTAIINIKNKIIIADLVIYKRISSREYYITINTTEVPQNYTIKIRISKCRC